MTATCETCRWWDKSAATLGTCRINAPVAHVNHALAQWPWTANTAWCGEHQPKEAPHDQN